MTRKLHLNAFLMGTGHHEAAWRHPDSRPEDTLDARHYINLAQIAERGKLDSIFFADGLAARGNVKYNSQNHLEPITLLSAISVLTERIGLIATASTTYYEPYQLARKFASLDHISNGRAGWNIVTSAGEDEARNFNLDKRPAHADRYSRATEFVEVVQRLWDSWEDGARVLDKEHGYYADASRVHAIDHEGEHFQVRGPLNVPRPRAGSPAARAGRLVGGRQGVRRAVRRGGVHRAADPRRRAGVLHRPEVAGGQVRPTPGGHRDPARHLRGARRHRGRGARPRRPSSTT